ncbi:SatD family protein [Microbacterium sp. W1N]|uniref:SatD family protein n=1 Tax=Microbacterium festucae TaxID=2977531 RepID=UPI0021C075EF|nr:SatD family protein [Microbacterium festucae]MCT9821453.1 SatD family protein [Microbacterium festucae]
MDIAVIADIVGSRQAADRAAVQRAIETTARRVDREGPAARTPLAATVGDEFQAVYPSLPAALAALLLIQLDLPDGASCRFGIGVGQLREVAATPVAIADGPGWWAARDAIEQVHALQDRAVPSARTRIVGAPEEDADMHAHLLYANAYLLARDEVVGAMSERARRLTYGRCLGVTQRDLAQAEGISQSAVSQALLRAGSGAVVAGFAALTAEAAR